MITESQRGAPSKVNGNGHDEHARPFKGQGHASRGQRGVDMRREWCPSRSRRPMRIATDSPLLDLDVIWAPEQRCHWPLWPCVRTLQCKSCQRKCWIRKAPYEAVRLAINAGRSNHVWSGEDGRQGSYPCCAEVPSASLCSHHGDQGRAFGHCDEEPLDRDSDHGFSPPPSSSSSSASSQPLAEPLATIQHSEVLSSVFADFSRKLDSRRIKNLQFRKHRFNSVQKPTGRCILCLKAVISTAIFAATHRRGERDGERPRWHWPRLPLAVCCSLFLLGFACPKPYI